MKAYFLLSYYVIDYAIDYVWVGYFGRLFYPF